ncbi:hypothetical protein DL764_008835 [Monosporascus ibericus]|uniref:feruloyl esterase n=1 Tax=Monosporascus ibericus TaxID=155417 RepID=A0A4Q4SZX2_9PEZI|nr:hypothetical protein DL764_008835 [Monosporascus ibericus]
MHWWSTAASAALHLALLITGPGLAAPAPEASTRAASAASAGCGAVPEIVDGASRLYSTAAGRTYRVFLPRDYDENTPAPLILSYHGAGGVIDQQADLDRLARPEVNTDHIVVYLQGNADDPSQPERYTWQGAPENHSDDIRFTREALDAILATYCVDPSRVYATGMSQGGGFAGRLACSAEMSARIAAYAPVAGAYYQKQVDEEEACEPATVDIDCESMRKRNRRTSVPIMAFHGGSDDIIRYEGGFRNGACLPAVKHWIDRWVEADGLRGMPANDTIEGSDGGVIMRHGGGLVTLVYAGDDVGHAWMSRSNGDLGRQTQGLREFG